LCAVANRQIRQFFYLLDVRQAEIAIACYQKPFVAVAEPQYPWVLYALFLPAVFTFEVRAE
jgi:hypothetical protein